MPLRPDSFRRLAVGIAIASLVGGASLAAAQTPPTVSTSIPTSVPATSTVVGGTVSDDGGSTVTRRGVVFSATNTSPTIGGADTGTFALGAGTGHFSGTLFGLASGTTYYVKAYATNGSGTAYGATLTFQTAAAAPTATDQNVAMPEGTTTPITLSGYDPNSPPRALTYAIVTLPSHGSVSTSPGGNWIYVPFAGYLGPDSFTFTVSNGTLTSSPATVSIRVVYAPRPATPVVTVPANGSTVNATPVDTGIAGPNTIVEVYVDNSLMGRISSSGTGNWSIRQPSALSYGSHSVYAVANSGGVTSPKSNTSLFIVAPPISVNPTTLPNPTVAAAYSQNISASGGTAPYTYAITSGALPAGVTLSSGGALAGTPTAGGIFNFAVTATDGNGKTGARSYTLSVARPVISIAPAMLPSGIANVPYSQNMIASGGTASYSYSLIGSLPIGITLAADGTLSGTTTTAGSFHFTVRATDSSTGQGPYAATRDYTLVISAPAITLAPATFPAGTVGSAYRETLTASGGNGSFAFAITSGALPAGVTLSSGGALAGMPTAGGTFNFTATAFDGNGKTGTRGYTLTIAAATIAINPVSIPAGKAGVAYSQAITASGGTAPDNYAVTSGALPAGLTLAANGTLAGTPTANGTFTFAVTATDASTGSGPYASTRSYTLLIAAGMPTVTSIAPNSGTTPGGTSVTIIGTNFTGATAVTIGGNAATGVSVVNTTTISAITPAGAAGPASVLVTAPGGTNVANALYTYVTPAPTVTSVTPNSGSPLGGTAITITGTNFTNASALTIGGVPATSFAVTSATTINATTPAHAPGSVDVAVTTPGGTGTGAGLYTYSVAITATALTSSRNPSEAGQAVTFTATVTSSTSAPSSGAVTFLANGAPIGTAALAAGLASFATASLGRGSIMITASYAGGTGFAASTSAALIQVVTTPSDSLKLGAMQKLAAPVAAQAAGQAISGAIDTAIAEGFAGGDGALMAPSASIRFNVSGEPETGTASLSPTAKDPFLAGNTGRNGVTLMPSRTDAFSAMAYAMPTKAPPLPPCIAEPRDWLGWAEVRGATLDRWSGSATSASATPTLYGRQINFLAGRTRLVTPTFLVGVVSGYETFDYRADALQGRLKGHGWTVGAYLGWKLAPTLRYDAAVAYSGIGYDGTAGTASGTFGGQRWLLSTGLTGTYAAYGMQIEPSAKVYALWKNENAYVDSLGTQQAQRHFATGRASGGVKLAYPVAWTQGVVLAPFVGLYGDYYFNSDSSAVLATANPAAIVLDGWSARAVAGVAANFGNGATIAVGGELGGIGNASRLTTYRARASMPFAAQ